MSYNNREYQKTNITTNTTTAVFTGRGTLHTIVINTTAAGSITLQDGSTAFAVLKASIGEGTYTYDVSIANGLNVVTAGASDVTVTWTKG